MRVMSPDARLKWLGVVVAALASLALQAFAPPHIPGSEAGPTAVSDLVELAPVSFQYRAAGDFIRGGKPATAPLIAAELPRGLAIMRHQVTAADYQRCVRVGGCPAADRGAALADRPTVKVSWWDAVAYAAWLSRETGAHFRLPTDAEWAYAAGSRFRDDALPDGADPGDPGRRALARYEREAETDAPGDAAPQPVGTFGANENGVVDLSGNVWEWTDSCFVRSALDTDGRPSGAATINCGVRVVEGRHRAYMTDFIRDPRGGGCSLGAPPSNLGFRLVREEPPQEAMAPWLRSMLERARARLTLR
jgi:formylglycine-generating enzyme required for sulfatase activity